MRDERRPDVRRRDAAGRRGGRAGAAALVALLVCGVTVGAWAQEPAPDAPGADQAAAPNAAVAPGAPIDRVVIEDPGLAAGTVEAPTALEPGLWGARLANGLDVIVVEDHSVPLVTVEIAVRNGAFTEPPAVDGLSHLYEHMFFKGNAVIPTQEAYMARQRELGMAWNGTTSTERVNYFFTLASDRLAEGLEFMRDAIRSPRFDARELERERVVVLDEFNRNEANPGFHLARAINRRLWHAHFSRKNTIGDRAVLATASPEQMRAMQALYYHPNNAALFISGDVERGEAFALAEALYGDWPRGPDPFTAAPIPSHPPLAGSEAVIVEQDVQTVTLRVAWHGPDVADDPAGTYAADVLSFILNQRSAAFQKALVDSGLALGASVGYYTQRHTGAINVTLTTTPEQLAEAAAALDAELARLAEPGYFTDAQLEAARTLLEVSDLYSREKTSDWTHTLSFWWAVAGVDYYLGYLEALAAVSRADIERYVRTYIQDQPHVVGVLIHPEARARLGLDAPTVLSWLP